MVVSCIRLIQEKVKFLFWNKNTMNGTNILRFFKHISVECKYTTSHMHKTTTIPCVLLCNLDMTNYNKSWQNWVQLLKKHNFGRRCPNIVLFIIMKEFETWYNMNKIRVKLLHQLVALYILKIFAPKEGIYIYTCLGS